MQVIRDHVASPKSVKRQSQFRKWTEKERYTFGKDAAENGNINTLKEETFAEESFAILRFLAKFAKVCSREIFVIYKLRKFILAEKIRALD